MKRRLPLCFALSLFISQQALAQPPTNDSRFEIGLTSEFGAFDIPSVFNSRSQFCIEGCRINNSNRSFSFTIGLDAQYKLGQSLRLATGITYSSNSYKEEFIASDGANFYTSENKRSFNFINVPLTVNASLFPLNKDAFSVYGELGFINHLNLTKEFPDPESDIELKRYGLSGTVGTGLRFSKKRYVFEVGPFFTHSLTSFGRDRNPLPPQINALNQEYTQNEFTPYSAGISFSARIKL